MGFLAPILLAGVGLLAICIVVALLSAPAARNTWRRARPTRWQLAAAAVDSPGQLRLERRGAGGWQLAAPEPGPEPAAGQRAGHLQKSRVDCSPT